MSDRMQDKNDLLVLLALEEGSISEGQAATCMGLDRVGVRERRLQLLEEAIDFIGGTTAPTAD